MADIVLKDRNGSNVTYAGIETVTFDTTTEGVQATYTKGVAVEDLEIIPDFSGGDMAVSAAEGTLVKSAVIRKPVTEEVAVGEDIPMDFSGGTMEILPSAADRFLSRVTVAKPEALIPENIAEGVDIGGIIGTLVAGGGAKVATGIISTAKTSSFTVDHNLGVLPDVVFIFTSSTWTYSQIAFIVSFSKSFTDLYGNYGLWYGKINGAGKGIIEYYSANIDGTSAQNGFIYNGNETSFAVSASSTYQVLANSKWIAIGGLT